MASSDVASGGLGGTATGRQGRPPTRKLAGCGPSVCTSTCGVRSDGTLWCWGYNYYGQLGNGLTTDSASPVQVTTLGASVAQVSAQLPHTCARKTDGTLWCWGYNGYGQLGDGTTANRTTPVQVRRWELRSFKSWEDLNFHARGTPTARSGAGVITSTESSATVRPRTVSSLSGSRHSVLQ